MARTTKAIGAVCVVGAVVSILMAKMDNGSATYPLRMSAEAMVDLTGKYEGCRTRAYNDGGNIATVGIGSTSAVCGAVDKNKTYTLEEIAERLNKDLYVSEQCVNVNFNGWDLPQRQFEALTDFVFNVGCTTATRNKTGIMTGVRRNVLQGNVKEACKSLLTWVYGRNAKGEKVVVQGLYNRRFAEYKWCMKDD